MCLSFGYPRGGRFAVALIVSILAAQTAIATDRRKSTELSIATDSVACLRKADSLKIRHAINSLRYMGEIRSLVNDRRCEINTSSRSIIGLSNFDRSDRLAAVEIKTNDRPNEERWVLSRDIQETSH